MKTIALALAAFCGTAAVAAAQEVQVKMGTLAPEGSPWHSILRDMSEEWKGAMDGKLKVRIFAGGVAGDEPDMVRKMRIGELHSAALTGVGLAEIAPEVMALQLPMLIRTDEELDYVRERIAPKLDAILLKKGFIVLNWGEAGWCHFFSATKPVIWFEDVKKVKLFCWATGDGELAAWKDIGAHPVPLAATDIHTGLKSGLIDAFATTPIAALSFQWFGSATEMSDMNWAPLVGATIVTEKKWATIPEKVRPTLLVSAGTAGERFRKETRKQSAKAIDVMKENKLTVHHAPPEVLPEWEKQARIAWPKMMGKAYPPELVAEITGLLSEFRAKQKEGNK